MAGIPHLCADFVTTTSVQGSWEGSSRFTAARFLRDRNISRRYLVNLLLLGSLETKIYLEGIQLTDCRCTYILNTQVVMVVWSRTVGRSLAAEALERLRQHDD
jgi:hypothetical protein